MTIRKYLVSTLALVAIPATVSAEPLPKRIHDLECLVGNWKATGTAVIGKDRANIAATWQCKRTSAKYGVLCTLQITGMPGMSLYEETDLFGYEPNTDTYHWYSVTNAGETHDHVTKATAGNKVRFVYNGSQEGKPFKEAIDFEFGKDARTFVLRAETWLAGASTSVIELKARK
jgi:hypothetical protein